MLVSAFLWIKAIHIMAVISWMAAMLYMPRLFVYHVETTKHGDKASDTFAVMERKLLKGIMTPAMIVTWIAGFLMVFSGVSDVGSVWFGLKFLLVVVLSGFHGWCSSERKKLVDGQRRTGRQYRILNEVPAVVMVFIVILVVVKPF